MYLTSNTVVTRLGNRLALCASALLVASGSIHCNSPVSADAPGTQLWISATRLVVAVGDTTRVGFVVASGNDVRYSAGVAADPTRSLVGGTWSSSDSTVAFVQPGGLLVAVEQGSAVLRIRSDGLSDTALVFVVASSDPAPSDFVDIQVGLGHACGLTRGRLVLCWGISWFGETGAGSARKYTATVSPAPVRALTDVVSLAVGGRHSCALVARGEAYCWGEDIAAIGGIGTARPTPTSVDSRVRFSAIAAGGEMTCGLTDVSQLLCWGIGTNGLKPVSTPVPLAAISVGYDHACGLSPVGEAYCFGTNNSGQLGTGDLTARAAMTRVETSLRFLTVSAGLDYTCAVALDRRAYCWGGGSNGRLGTGDAASSARPREVRDLSDVTAIDAGAVHTCAVTSNGGAYCWGEDLRGELGDGPPVQQNPTAADLIRMSPTRVQGGLSAAAISAGWGETTCALENPGRAFCWGLNSGGQVGTGRHDFAPGLRLRFYDTPVAVRVIPQATLTRVTASARE